MNPLLNQIKNASTLNTISDIGQIYNLFKSGGNPMVLFNQLAQTNPQIQPIANMLRQGANPQQLFYSECQKRGVNPQDVLNKLNGR